MATIGTLLTFEEFERLPERPGKTELLRGELVEMPPADHDHHDDSETIRDLLKIGLEEAHARGEALELGKAHQEKGYKLAEDGWVVPDVSVTHAGQPVDRYMQGAPAIAIEVISPSNSAEAMDIKIELYFEYGALEVWLVYPKTRHIDVYTGPEKWTRFRDTVETPLIPGFSIKIAAILG